MKKLLLCGVALTVALSVSAQNRIPGKKTPARKLGRNIIVTKNLNEMNIDNATPLRSTSIPSNNLNHTYKTSAAVSEYVIGTTEYDLQSNRACGRRIVNNLDGTISADWTFSTDRGSYATRGTGYNYFDGVAWGPLPTVRIEPIRTGFANMAVSNGNEYTLAHDGTYGVLMKRAKGTGTWARVGGVVGDSVKVVLNNTNASDVWFRLATGGPDGNTVHAIVNSQGSGTTPILGQRGPLTYSRSLDGGLTWDIKHIVLPGGDSSFYKGVSAETYSIDAEGSTVAIVAGSIFMDIVMWKSTDNGSTWTKTIIVNSPLTNGANNYNLAPFGPLISDADGDGIADQVFTNAGDPNVSLDANGIAHVSWTGMFATDSRDTTVETFNYSPTTDSILYWNENLTGGPVGFYGSVDQNGDGLISTAVVGPTSSETPFGTYGLAGVSCHTQVGFGTNGAVYLVYSSVSELTDTLNYSASLRHVFVVGSTDNGVTWTYPYDVVPSAAQNGDGEYQEAVWPSIAKTNSGCIHIVYQRDPVPEYFVNNTSSYGPQNTSTNDIVYVCVPENDVVAVNEITTNSESFTISQNFPNPFNGTTRFEINLKNNANAKVEVYNVLGKLVKSMNLSNLTAGNNTVTLDLAGLNAGLYTYSVTVGTEKLTRTLMVK